MISKNINEGEHKEPWARPQAAPVHNCRLVNPLCPNDLCWLPANHAGSVGGIHWLSTMAEPDEVSDIMYLSHYSHSRSDLMDEGQRSADSLFPDDPS